MTVRPSGVLYSPQLLSLAVELADYPIRTSAPALGHARSRTCGSTIALSSMSTGVVSEPGLKVAACAVGQAAAAIFARSAEGLTARELQEHLEEIAVWLSGGEGLPRWPRFTALIPARDYPGRHEAIQLPWRAAIDALCKGEGGG
ncbi:iron-sulfur cluster assembly scaffold protein [Qipengyuania sp. RANM35]|uniref:iron-sulfur cluster assembly scaffold protein n=1 Tax=Qipengyuania sp. RANM35 TaxID=3068635 RepID=UPI0034DB3974